MKDIAGGAVATVFGVVALLVAAGFGADRAWFFSRAETTTGTVIELRENRWSNTGSGGKYPVVEFETRSGQRLRCEGWSSRPPAYGVGEVVTVHYVPGDPDAARLDDFAELWLVAIISGGLAALLLPLGVVLLFLGFRRRALERLRKTGVRMRGTVVRAETSSVQQWGKTVQHLTVETTNPATGRPIQFRSHAVPGKGDEWLGKELDVFMDARKPKRFLIDAPQP